VVALILTVHVLRVTESRSGDPMLQGFGMVVASIANSRSSRPTESFYVPSMYVYL
jgi:hypothetical protein